MIMNVAKTSLKTNSRLLRTWWNLRIGGTSCTILWTSPYYCIQPLHHSLLVQTYSTRQRLDKLVTSPYFRTVVGTSLLTTAIVAFPFLFTFTIMGAFAWTIYRLIIRPGPGARTNFVDVLFPGILGTNGLSERARELRQYAIDVLSQDRRLRNASFSDIKTFNTKILEINSLRRDIIIIGFLVLKDEIVIGEVQAVENSGEGVRIEVNLYDGAKFNVENKLKDKVIDAEHWTVRKD